MPFPKKTDCHNEAQRKMFEFTGYTALFNVQEWRLLNSTCILIITFCQSSGNEKANSGFTSKAYYVCVVPSHQGITYSDYSQKLIS